MSSKKGTELIKGKPVTVLPSKKGKDIERKTSSQGHTVSKAAMPSSLSKKSGDITKGAPLDPSQIHKESESESAHHDKSGEFVIFSSTHVEPPDSFHLITLSLHRLPIPLLYNKQQAGVQASQSVPKDSLMQQHILDEGLPTSLDITSTTSVSALVEK